MVVFCKDKQYFYRSTLHFVRHDLFMEWTNLAFLHPYLICIMLMYMMYVLCLLT